MTICSVDSRETLEFLSDRHGKSFLDDEGYVRGITKKGESCWRSIECQGTAKSEKSERCLSCEGLNSVIKKAKSKYLKSLEAGTQKFTPISSLKAPPYVLQKIRDLHQENEELHELLKNQEDLIDINV